MASTTLATIVSNMRTVLEASPFTFIAARDQFSHDRQPNSVLDSSYWIQDEGLGSSRWMTNNTVARLDRLSVFVARKLKFNPVAEVDTLQDTLVDIERYLIADGPDNSYSVQLIGRRVTRPPDKDIAIGSVTVQVDFDFSEAVA